jgi:hypothetical protein
LIYAGIVGLTEEVTKLMDDAVKGSPSMLRYTTGESGPPTSDLGQLEIAQSLLLGQRRAITRLAEVIEKLQGDS